VCRGGLRGGGWTTMGTYNIVWLIVGILLIIVLLRVLGVV
jgi:hypothetical protein